MDRRNLLKAGAAAAAGVALAAAGTGTAFADSGLPPVPGMLGDRRANELWYQLDEIALYHPSQEVTDAYTALGSFLKENAPEGLYQKWRELSREPGYPRNYAELVKPMEQPFRTLSTLQLDNFDRFYRWDETGLVSAFASFGQGVLFDPRRADVESEVHTMNGNPPSSYHFWYAIQRAQMLLGIDRHRWARIGPMTGFAWGLQSIAKPDHRHVNPPLPREQVQHEARYWLRRTPAELDRDFQSSPYPG
ncbi:twin-arginine translocation signal domain-containing protein [Amycolatopsis sp. NPDC049688]|uniref:twin-arginine translocation signal domain-containing protein n=1 Tax=Amycolatopsis sp. NPDC049688 TaxID=3154733 RepID=UPI00341273BD